MPSLVRPLIRCNAVARAPGAKELSAAARLCLLALLCMFLPASASPAFRGFDPTNASESDDANESQIEPVVIVTRKHLKVCTVGDDPPLSYYNHTSQEFSGLAATVLRQFAPSHNYSVVFVKTPRNALLDHLVNSSACALAIGESDLASKVAQDTVGVSLSLMTNAKIPVFSEGNEERFQSLEDIDRRGTTVLYARGNEDFIERMKSQGLLEHAVLLKLNGTVAETLACVDKYRKLPFVAFADSVDAKLRAHMAASNLSMNGVMFKMPKSMRRDDHKVYLANSSPEGESLLADLDRYLMGAQATGLFEAWRREAFDGDYHVERATCTLNPKLA